MKGDPLYQGSLLSSKNSGEKPNNKRGSFEPRNIIIKEGFLEPSSITQFQEPTLSVHKITQLRNSLFWSSFSNKEMLVVTSCNGLDL